MCSISQAHTSSTLPLLLLLLCLIHTCAEEAYTDELIEQILENYTFKFEPEVRLKLKHRSGGCGVEGDWCQLGAHVNV